MTKTLRLSTLALGAGLLAGCGASGGFIRDAVSTQQLEYRMDVSGVRYVKPANGSASTGSVLCIIPLSGHLYQEAMQELYLSAELAPNQVIMNLREDYSIRSYLGFYCTRQLTVSGDVFELTPSSAAGRPVTK
ncbi:hypothetical protein JRI60_44060 [Archangium violaceum]|uniref:DUF6567 family protein n=1 Tax=Archangium violaceum TaxID=83451 RepID=UPI00194E6352|nr:DUF6567 family protein [Archangium violaceum]QRN95943.1 hypothetical protein JRI60_44060 [Archangium violaceum]